MSMIKITTSLTGHYHPRRSTIGFRIVVGRTETIERTLDPINL